MVYPLELETEPLHESTLTIFTKNLKIYNDAYWQWHYWLQSYLVSYISVSPIQKSAQMIKKQTAYCAASN